VNVLRLFLLLLVPLAANGAEAGGNAERCDAIRARIGVAPLADPDLLRLLAARKDCAFTAAEVYRAAYGDKPPAPATPQRRHHHEADDED
jgi:hypothetical protein